VNAYIYLGPAMLFVVTDPNDKHAQMRNYTHGRLFMIAIFTKTRLKTTQICDLNCPSIGIWFNKK
jgi:hypothetical protein